MPTPDLSPAPTPATPLAFPDSTAPAPSPAAAEADEASGAGLLLGLLAAVLALGAAGAALWARRRNRVAGIALAVPIVERPSLGNPPPPEGAVPPPAPGEPLQVALEPLQLSLTLINATLAYRLAIANRGTETIRDLAVSADMISAHASMSRDEQLAGPGAQAAVLQRIDSLAPGESRVIEGEFRVPFSNIVPIRQGNAALLLPIARFRLEGAGSKAAVRSFVVGQPGAGTGLQPFRLDQGPRVFPRLAQRAFA